MTQYDTNRRGAFLIAVTCSLLGSAAVFFLIYNVTYGYHSMQWPKTKGTIIGQWIEKSYSYRSSLPQYSPHISYEYTVGYRLYKEDTIGYPAWRSSLSYAQGKLALYPLTAKVDVFYDPKNPIHSCLEPGISMSFIYLMGTGSCLFLGLGIMGFCYYFKKQLRKLIRKIGRYYKRYTRKNKAKKNLWDCKYTKYFDSEYRPLQAMWGWSCWK